MNQDPTVLVLVVAALGCAALLAGAIVSARRRHDKPPLKSKQAEPERGRKKALVYGSDELGQMLAAELENDPGYEAVGFIDDNPRRRGTSRGGLPVVGQRADIGDVVDTTGAECLFLARGSLSEQDSEFLSRLGEKHGLQVWALPTGPGSLEAVALGHARNLIEAAQLRPEPVAVDLDATRSVVEGRRVLITGAASQIGRALGVQLAAMSPANIAGLDRNAEGMERFQREVSASSPDPGSPISVQTLLADLTKDDQSEAAFRSADPDIVIHAAFEAAHPSFEDDPTQAIDTNVWGTANVLNLALQAECPHFVTVSNGKAPNPASAVGATRALAERLTTWAATLYDDRYVSVRIGDLLGSRDSVIMGFTEQVRAGGPVTVTHPDATRHFIEPEAAAQLLLEAMVVGNPGEVVAVDYPEPTGIIDVVRRLISWLNPSVDVVFTGLHAGGKVREDLVGTGDFGQVRANPALVYIEGNASLEVADALSEPAASALAATSEALDERLGISTS